MFTLYYTSYFVTIKNNKIISISVPMIRTKYY